MGRHMSFLVMRLDLDVHQVLDLEGVEVAAHHHAQIVADELHDMVILDDARVLGEHRALVRVLDVVLDRHQAFLAHLGEDLEQHGQQIHVEGLVQVRALEHRRQRGQGCLDRLDAVAGDKTAQRQAEDRHVFQRHPQRRQAAMHGIGADGRRHNDYIADYQEHFDFIRNSGPNSRLSGHTTIRRNDNGKPQTGHVAPSKFGYVDSAVCSVIHG